jgi:acyl-coenzyme A synthetase/AMP-(fatty) acid ligase/rubrerythrin
MKKRTYQETMMLCPACLEPRPIQGYGEAMCCAGAPSQWHCLQCGETSEGFAFPYGRCPHCGGELALAQASHDPGAGAAALTAVRTAFEIELGGRAFYQQAAVEARDDEMRALFRRFADMEGAHMEELARRYHVTDVAARSPGFRIELAAVFAGIENRPGDPGNLFRIAIALENRAAGFFLTRASLAAGGSNEQRQYLELAAEEHEHAQTLHSEFRRWREARGMPVAEPQAPAPVERATALVNGAAMLLSQGDPGRIALACGEQQLSYGDLRDRVARAAGLWRQRGLRPGDRVAIKLPDGIDWVVAFLGTIWAGGVAVAVNPQIPAAEWHYILDEAGFNVILAANADDTPAPWDARVMLVDESRRAVAAAQPIAPHAVDEGTPAFWCHSSGTSGKPKAVVHKHSFARDIERISRERVGIISTDRLFATSRLFFSYPQTNSLFAGLKMGATVILDPQWPTAASVAATVARMRPTVFFSVPSLYRNLLHGGFAPALAATGLRRCVSAGEALPPSLREAWRDATGLGMVDGYGASETLVLVLTAQDGDDGLRPSPGVEVKPLDDKAADSGVPTRLCFRVSTLAMGYLDRPAAQAESFREGAFCPADLFLRTEGGGWKFAGREDSLVKIKGRWVNLVELEERLSTGTAGLLEAATVCVPDPDGVDAIAMFYVPRPGERAAVEEALRQRAAALPPYQRPMGWHSLEALPRTATGKLLRRRLIDMLRAEGEA